MQQFRTLAVLLFIFLFSTVSFSQFFAVPDGASKVIDGTGSQVLPKIATVPDGGCYVSWFDNRAKGYAVYLQLLSTDGEYLFPEKGLLVSDHEQATSLVDYDLKSDSKGNAIITFMDYRSGDPDIFVYKISPTGEFLWGKDGIALSGTPGYEAQPKIAVTKDDEATICWMHNAGGGRLAMQRISADGKKLWGESPLYYGKRDASFEDPQPVPSDSNSVIVVYNVAIGNFPQVNVAIAAEKFTSTGKERWGQGVVYIQSEGQVMPYTPPSVKPDGENGAVIAWHDDRDLDNKMVVYTQKLNSNGTFEFPLNGAEVASVPGNSYSPVAVRLGVTKEVMVIWKGTDRSQSESGLFVQIIDENGERKFGNEGMALVSPGQQSISGYNLTSTGNSAFIAFVSSAYGAKETSLQFLSLNSAGIYDMGRNMLIADGEGEKARIEMVTGPDNSSFMAFESTKDKDDAIWASKLRYDFTPGNLFSPISLSDLHAWNMGPEVVVKWTTINEEGKWNFKLERKTVDSDWVTVSEVAGKGYFRTTANYEVTDKAPADTRVVYRLTMKSYRGDEVIRDLGQIVNTSYPIVK